MRVRRLIVYHPGSSDVIPEEQSSVPFRRYAGMPATHDRLQSGINEGDDGLRIGPSYLFHNHLHFPARTEGAGVEGQDVGSVVSATPRQSQRITRQCSRALIGPAWA